VNADHLFLPHGYNENLADDADVEVDLAIPAYQVPTRTMRRYEDPVYRFAARRSKRRATVLDLECGIGDNLVRRLARRGTRCVGVDGPDAIAAARGAFPDQEWVVADVESQELWNEIGALAPDLVICAGVIERVDDPIQLLVRLRGVLSPSSSLVLSTPDRARIAYQPALGPPADPHHVREWTQPELAQLIEAHGFAIRTHRHVLPCRYPRTVSEAMVVLSRAVRLRPLPGRRSTMVFELTRG
jgi:SAM-dependent methyltransferase